jgi:hypothetical protein
MFMRVVRSSVDPAKIEDALALGDEIIAAMKRQAGFVGVSRATGSFTTVSTWKSEDAAKLPVREVMATSWTGSRCSASK